MANPILTPQTRLIIKVNQLSETTNCLEPTLFQVHERNNFKLLIGKLNKLHSKLHFEDINEINIEFVIQELSNLKSFFDENLDGTVLMDIEFGEAIDRLLTHAKTIQLTMASVLAYGT
ncbi:MAG: hypothetical protein A3E87_01050 [Gammaproteobacteria bacterium RIFCSPHIGHO2_12_FULL_35_23]|nr:MAG: hypothetical protein A3E87_01050 [Gammaproteobacteria bacterium RIFCSPHIGHO2_12_FULL_35_23]